jgi:hypothetical protein
VNRPSFQFYPGDWASNPNLKRCNFAERGIWLEVMCLMHDQPEYGVLRWPLKEIAQAVGCRAADLQSLSRKTVLKGSDDHLHEPFVYTPRSGRKDGEPVTLIGAQPGPIWYSSRMVKDEHIRIVRGLSGGDPDAPKGTPKPPPKAPPKAPPKVGIGEALGAPFGPRGSSSSSSGSEPMSVDIGGAQATPKHRMPDCPHEQIIDLYHQALPTGTRVRSWNGIRPKNLQARWREDTRRQNLEWWRRFFAYCAKSEFLTGQTQPVPGREPFVVSLDWLIAPQNFAKCVEGKYNRSAA